jgi:putative ABC transport system permease protein
MTLAGLVARNLLRRPIRTALTALGVAVGVALIVALLAIRAGVEQTAGQLIHVGRADFGLFQAGADDLTRSVLPESLAREVARDPGVADTARIFLLVGSVEGRDSSLLFGYVPGEFPERRMVVVAGRRPHGAEALVGDEAARTLHLAPGDIVHVGRRGFRVAGLFHTGNAFVDRATVLPLRTVQQLAHRPDEVTTIAVTVHVGESPKVVARRVERDVPGLRAVVEPGQAVKIDTTSRLIVDAGWIFGLLALIAGGIGVTNTMAMAVHERVREIGIMRAIGWRSSRIAALILGEAVAIGLLALGAGLVAGWAAAELFTSRGDASGLVTARFTPAAVGYSLLFALGVGLFGALYPAWLAVRLTPIEALRRE